MRTWKRKLAYFLILAGCLGWVFNIQAAPPKPGASDPKSLETIDKSKFLKLPDLTIEYINIIPPSPKLGETMTIQFAIKNIGSDIATPAIADLYAMGFAYALNIPSYINTQQLSPGQSQVFTYSGILKSKQNSYEITTGKHNFGVDLNLKKNPVESNYQNNYKVNEFYIAPAGGSSNQPLPDLTVSVLVLSPPELTSGGPAAITMTVANNGPGPSGPTKAFFSGSSVVLQALGLPVAPTSIPIPSLNPGQSDTFNYSAPGGKLSLAPGSYTLAALVNTMTGAVPETNTNNNSKTITFTVQLPKATQVPKGPMELKTK
jgi:subtilase family serine protease